MHTELGSSQVDVQQCALSWEVGEELGDELAMLARRKWRWKRRRRGGGPGGQLVRRRRRRRRRRKWRACALIKSNNPHLAGGEQNFVSFNHVQSHFSWLSLNFQVRLDPVGRDANVTLVQAHASDLVHR